MGHGLGEMGAGRVRRLQLLTSAISFGSIDAFSSPTMTSSQGRGIVKGMRLLVEMGKSVSSVREERDYCCPDSVNDSSWKLLPASLQMLSPGVLETPL